MMPNPDERRGLARESRKVKRALDELAALAMPAPRPATVDFDVPPLTATNSIAEMAFDDLPDVPPPFVPPPPTPSERLDSVPDLDGFFADLPEYEPADHADAGPPTEEVFIDAFAPGTGEDLFEGFGSEANLAFQSATDTVLHAARPDGDATPPDGYRPLPPTPPAAESIADVLDGFDW